MKEDAQLSKKKMSSLGCALRMAVFLVVLLFFVILCGWLYGRYQLEKAISKFDNFPRTIAEFSIYNPPPPDNEKALARFPLPPDPYFPSVLYNGVAYELDDLAKEKLREYLECDMVKNAVDILNQMYEYPAIKYIPDYVRIDTMMPHLRIIRGLARMNAMRIIQAVDQGDTAEALKIYHESGNLKNFVIEDKTYIGYLVAMACEKFRLDALRYILSFGSPTSEELKALIPEFDEPQKLFREYMPEVIKMEAASCYQLYLTREPKLDMDGYIILFIDTWVPVPVFVYTYLNPWRPVDFAFLINRYYDIFSECGKEYYLLPPDDDEVIDQLYFYSKMLLPPFNAYHRKMAETISYFRAAKVSVAIKLYQMKYDKLPDTLDELVPEFLDAIPMDTFTGDPVKYRKGNLELVTLQINVDMTKREDILRVIKTYPAFNVYSLGGNYDSKANPDFGGEDFSIDPSGEIRYPDRDKNTAFSIIVDEKYIKEDTALSEE